MNERTIRILEFEVIQRRVADRCDSEEAAALVMEQQPLLEREAVETLKAMVAQLVAAVDRLGEEPRESLPSIGSILTKLTRKGVSLEVKEAYALGLFLYRAERIRKWLCKAFEDFPASPLWSLLRSLPDCTAVEGMIFQILDRDGNLRDLPELRLIRENMARLSRELEQRLRAYTTNEEIRRMLQSELPSQRDGRIVLALKANFRGRIKGIVHEVSGTGQTVFIEPLDIVEKNNQIVLEQQRLEAEIHRIFRDLTEKIEPYQESLALFHRQLLYLETLRARSRYSRETKGVFAEDRGKEKGALVLRQARHPLLGNRAVPIDIAFREGVRAVIITGPNTGGKTVTLKTVGLCALMNQYGLAIPAAEGSSLPIFDGMYADIGDEQSIHQSLSTFSAHMVHIGEILQKATSASLLLMDELGAGTDPEEGGALAMALMDYLVHLKVWLLVTTHHGVLKNYGYTHEGVENASVEFDSTTLSPTYRIIMGIPGESRALDIALRNGIPKDIVEQARRYIEEERTDVAHLIVGLKEKHREVEALRGELQKERALLWEERRKVDLQTLKLKQAELHRRSEDVSALQRFLQESRKTLENLVRHLREGELTKEKTREVKEFLASLEGHLEKEARSYEAEYEVLQKTSQTSSAEEGAVLFEKGKGSEKYLSLQPGMAVLVLPAKQRGELVREAGNSRKGIKRWVVAVGAVKITVEEKSLVPLKEEKEKQRVPIVAQVELRDDRPPPVLELNLRGMRLDEALEAVERQIQGAVLAGFSEFSIIHGKGEGILQKGVQDYLKNHPLVASFAFAHPEQGGFGKTVVILKR
ncbi:MAG: endonuclease MutS2 [Treponemataceae bacterium]|nr:endonuclease MutS2 [Treponemataceae bacterium]